MCYLISQTESLEVVSHVLAICNISYIVGPIQYERDDVCNQNTTYIGSISMDRIRLSQARRPNYNAMDRIHKQLDRVVAGSSFPKQNMCIDIYKLLQTPSSDSQTLIFVHCIL